MPLVALLLVAILLALSRPVARGALASLATFAKFAPALLAPMLLTYSPRRDARRPLRPVAGCFAAGLRRRSASLALLWPAIDPGLKTFYDRTIGFQAGRDSPFTIWGQVPSLELAAHHALAATAALSLALAFGRGASPWSRSPRSARR